MVAITIVCINKINDCYRPHIPGGPKSKSFSFVDICKTPQSIYMIMAIILL